MLGTMFQSSLGCDCASTASENKYTNGTAKRNRRPEHNQRSKQTVAAVKADQISKNRSEIDITLGFPLNRIPGAENVIAQAIKGKVVNNTAAGSDHVKSQHTLFGKLVSGLIDARTAVDRAHVTLELTDATLEQPHRQFIGRHHSMDCGWGFVH